MNNPINQTPKGNLPFELWMQKDFRWLAEILPERLVIKDDQSRFLWANRATLKILGVKDLTELVGKTDHDFFTEEHANLTLKDEKSVLSTGEPILDRIEQDTDAEGLPHWIYTTRIPLRDETQKIVGVFVMVRDMTDLKMVQESFERESTYLKALLENIPDAVYFKDTHSRFTRVGLGLIHHNSGSLDPVGKTDFDFFTKEHAQQAFDDEQEIIRTGIPLIDKIEKETYANQPDTWVSTTKVPIRDKENKITGIVGISRDVTSRFKAEEALQKAKNELEIRVQERTAALMQEIKKHLHTEKALRDGEQKLQEFNQRLEVRVEQLNFLNASAQRMSNSSWRRDLLPTIVESFAASRKGLIVALFEMEGGIPLLVAATPEFTEKSLEVPSQLLCQRLAPEGDSPVLIPDIRSDTRTMEMGFSPVPETSFLQIPLRIEDRTLAWVHVFGNFDFAMWYSQEPLVLLTLSAQAALSLSNSNSFHSLAAKARVESELAVAQNIQQRFMPQGCPDIPRVTLKGAYFPASEVGGDYLDYFKTESGDWVLVVADVSGKGIPAALVMTMLRSTIRAESRYEKTAKGLLCSVNDIMIKDLDSKSFITAACLILNATATTMTYARAGHPPLLIKHAQNQTQPLALSPRGLALGITDGDVFQKLMEEVTIPLEPGDTFLMYTDGLTEAMDPERHMYGMQRLQSLFSNDPIHSPTSLVDHILDDIRVFTQNEPAHDDLTLLAFEVAS